MIENLQERLRQGADAFKESTPTESGGFVKDWPPDGTYQGLIKGFDFFESKKGDVFLKTIVEVAFDRDHKGKEVETIHNLTDVELLKAGWLKTHLSRLGVDVDDLDLTAIGPGSQFLEGLLDVPVEFAIRSSDRTDDNGQPYRNVYVNQRLGDKMGGVVGGPMAGGKVQSDVPPDTDGMPGYEDDGDDVPF